MLILFPHCRISADASIGRYIIPHHWIAGGYTHALCWWRLCMWGITGAFICCYFNFIDILVHLFTPISYPSAWYVLLVETLPTLALDLHGASWLRRSGHQHQSAAAWGSVEETFWEALSQVVPQVTFWHNNVQCNIKVIIVDLFIYFYFLSYCT